MVLPLLRVVHSGNRASLRRSVRWQKSTNMASNKTKPIWWSWEQVIQHADRLGIPNFQRGAVWDSSNRAALLESLYEASPCGTLVVWEPEDTGDPTRHGTRLEGAFAPDARPMWLVDGQQRCRTLLGVFKDLISGEVAASNWALVSELELEPLRTIGKVLVHDVQRDSEDDDDNSSGAFDASGSETDSDDEGTSTNCAACAAGPWAGSTRLKRAWARRSFVGSPKTRDLTHQMGRAGSSGLAAPLSPPRRRFGQASVTLLPNDSTLSPSPRHAL